MKDTQINRFITYQGLQEAFSNLNHDLSTLGVANKVIGKQSYGWGSEQRITGNYCFSLGHANEVQPNNCIVFGNYNRITKEGPFTTAPLMILGSLYGNVSNDEPSLLIGTGDISYQERHGFPSFAVFSEGVNRFAVHPDGVVNLSGPVVELYTDQPSDSSSYYFYDQNTKEKYKLLPGYCYILTIVGDDSNKLHGTAIFCTPSSTEADPSFRIYLNSWVNKAQTYINVSGDRGTWNLNSTSEKPKATLYILGKYA